MLSAMSAHTGRALADPVGLTPAATTVKSAIAAAYDAAAIQYAELADRPVYRRLARPLVDVLAPHGGPLLDVAAGTGALGRWCRDVVSVDLSVGQLAHNPSRRRVLADAERLPFRDDAFQAAGCAFGINHFPDPAAAVREMARVAAVVGVLTWLRPAPYYAPKAVLDELLRRHLGRSRSPVGAAVDQLGDAVGSAQAVRALLADTGLVCRVNEIVINVPWPGLDAYLDYRLGMPSTKTGDHTAIRAQAAALISELPDHQLPWHAALVLGVGTRGGSHPK